MTPEFAAPRTAIVTGGARRIGCAIARALAADGWHVLIHHHSSDAAGLARELGASTVRADLVDPDAADTIIAALDGLPPPALLVNSAAGFALDQFDDFAAEQWDRHMAVNARAPAMLTRAFARAVPEGQGALVVNLLDAKLVQPNPDFFSYTVSKMALAGVMELSARVLAGRGIRVCGIAPSVTLVSGPQTRENFDAVHRLNALERGVTVEQIVETLRYVIATPTLTGQTIVLDGGQRFLGLARDVQFL
ncbi:SDR family oxidoreductase [Sphingomonas sp. MAH-20]|uniref:SDR family oxidoreductase n=1 Tax=Sphingomonas horti TaxID=2682842 RepID=A0A6I4J4J0_9SPHN|nr:MULTISPECIES: SDR family oxidoreductase [Sphingomonas]MBA2919234.1 SDR family oxidoreductase [Sphingomonas sp. CGMCC 1.13658]MVO79267.1 SDR family oxidoreductase [Sphingomonas horti]